MNQQKKELAKDLDLAQRQSQYDTYAKQILANKELLARILEHVIPEYAGMDYEEIMDCIDGEPKISEEALDPGMTNTEKIVGDNTEDNIPNEGYVTFDIKFHAYAKRSTKGKVIIDVESQQKLNLEYPIVSRGIYYCARMLSSQKERYFTKDHYQDIKKVYSIWICMSANEAEENSITHFQIGRKQIVGEIQCKEDDYDLLEVILIMLPKDFELDKLQDMDPLIKTLSIIFSKQLTVDKKTDLLENQCRFPMTKQIERGLKPMCNLGEALVWETRQEVTQEVTEKVTKEVTQQVTQQVTQDVTTENIIQAINMMKAIGASEDKIREQLEEKYSDFAGLKDIIENHLN